MHSLSSADQGRVPYRLGGFSNHTYQTIGQAVHQSPEVASKPKGIKAGFYLPASFHCLMQE
jgi:hypothetical protein